MPSDKVLKKYRVTILESMLRWFDFVESSDLISYPTWIGKANVEGCIEALGTPVYCIGFTMLDGTAPCYIYCTAGWQYNLKGYVLFDGSTYTPYREEADAQEALRKHLFGGSIR